MKLKLGKQRDICNDKNTWTKGFEPKQSPKPGLTP